MAVAIRKGDCCLTDSKGKCIKKCPTPADALLISCPRCIDDGCNYCDGRGYVLVDSCARKLVTADVWRLIKYAEFFEQHSVLPNGGGVLDQASTFIHGFGFYDLQKKLRE